VPGKAERGERGPRSDAQHHTTTARKLREKVAAAAVLPGAKQKKD